MSRILLVEDEQKLVEVVARELRLAGYEVVHAGDGEAAIEMQSRLQPDLVILDWMLPGLDGLEVLRRIRQASPVPVLMLTARSEEVDRVLGLEVGADDYLVKPFAMRELLARVRAMLRRMERVQQILESDRQRETAPIQVAGLVLDPAAYQVTLDGTAVELTRTEFDLLHFLLRNPGRVFSRNYLLDAVWGEHYVAGDRSVDNAVLRLRKKLGRAGECIETVWGVGYRFQAGAEGRNPDSVAR